MQNFRPISEEIKNPAIVSHRNAMRTRYIYRSGKSTNGVVVVTHLHSQVLDVFVAISLLLTKYYIPPGSNYGINTVIFCL